MFVAAEFAIVKVRSTRLQQLVDDGNKRARQALLLVTHADEFLSATQLGITLASLALGWIGEPAVAAVLVWPLRALARFVPAVGTELVVHSIAFVVAYSCITILHIVLGELVPKSMAIIRADAVVLFCAWPMLLFHRIFRWPVAVLNGLASAILRGVGFAPASEHQLSHSSEELRMLLSDSAAVGQLDEHERVLLDNVFAFSDRVARELMVPRNEMVCLFVDAPIAESVAFAMEAGHTRFPLCEGDKDKVLGMIHMQDLFRQHHELADLRQIMRPMLMVPETLSVSRLLKGFQRQKSQMAILVDEYGGTAGLVTLEDLLEEIVGDIQDEFDQEVPDVRPVGPGSFDIDGALRLEEAQERRGCSSKR